MSVKVICKNNKIYYRLYWEGRQREQLFRSHDSWNLQLAKKHAEEMNEQMRAGKFDYQDWFPNGTRLTRSAARKAEIATQPLAVEPEKLLTVREFYEIWITKKVPPIVRKGQARDYRQSSKYFLAVLGDRTLKSLEGRAGVKHIESLRDYMMITLKLSDKFMKNIVGSSFRAMIRDAKIDGRIDRNPFDELPPNWWPKTKKQVIDPFTETERDQILGYYLKHRPREYPFVYARFWIGAMRPSEAVALKWGDIDLQTHTIDIRGSRYLGVEDDTKTSASERTVELQPEDEQVLRGIMPLRVKPKTYVFTDAEGRPIDQSEFNRNSFQPVLRILEIRTRPFRYTRHSWISINLIEGSSPLWVCQQAGTSLAMLEKHYARYMRTDGGRHLRDYRTRQKSQIA